MSAEAFSQFQDRFHVIRLDGDIIDDQMKYLDPMALTDQQFEKACIKQITALVIKKPENRAMLLADKDSMKDYVEACFSAFKNIYSMWLSRHANSEVVEQSIKYMLKKLNFGAALVEIVRSYFIRDRKFLTGKHLADKIDEFLSMTNAKDMIKMMAEDVDMLAGIEKNDKRPLEQDETNGPNKRRTIENYWSPFSEDQQNDEDDLTVQGIKQFNDPHAMLAILIVQGFARKLLYIFNERERDLERRRILAEWKDEVNGLFIKYSDNYVERDLLYHKVENLMNQDPIFTITQSFAY